MKKCLLFLVTLMLLFSAANAQPPVGYIGLFADETHTSWCVYDTEPYYPVDLYIWCLPSINGQACAEFAVEYPDDPGIIKTTITQNSHISIAMGGLETGMSVCFLECQTDWHWMFKHELYINTSTKRTIRIIPHPDPDILAYQFANCLEDNPLEPCILFTNLYINSQNGIDPECSTTGTTPASWGAIKSLYEE